MTPTIRESWLARFMATTIDYTPPGLWLDPYSNIISADTGTSSNSTRNGMTMPKVRARQASSSAPQTTPATQP